MGKVIKGNFGGGQEKVGENSPADNATNKPAEVVEIKPGIQGDEPIGETIERMESDRLKNRALLKDDIASIAKEFPVTEISRLNKMTEALNYIASLAGIVPSKLRHGSSYRDNITVFQSMYAEGAKDELYKKFDDSSKEMWGKAPGYYLALMDTLRRHDFG